MEILIAFSLSFFIFFGMSYGLDVLKNKMYEINGVENIFWSFKKKILVAYSFYLFASIMLYLMIEDLVSKNSPLGLEQNIDLLSNMNNLEISPWYFFVFVIFFSGGSIFAIPWLIEVILFVLGLPFQYLFYKTTGKFTLITKKRKGIMGFLFEFKK